MNYNPLITQYFEAQKPFLLQHPMYGELSVTVFGLDAGFGIAELNGKAVVDGLTLDVRQAISLDKLLEILEAA